MNIQHFFSDQRRCKALTGLSSDEFRTLLPTFTQAWISCHASKKGRARKVGGGKKGKLPSMESKLASILLYLKCYPTFDLLGLLTNRERTRCCRSVHDLLPVLEMALGRTLALPKRRISTPEEFFHLFPEAKDVFLDGTERRTEKPKNLKRRKKLYSGKKKATTRKTIVVSDERRRILILTPTVSGRRHDKLLTEKAGVLSGIPKKISIWTDSGLSGIQLLHSNTIMPKKSSKHHPLTPAEKENNRIIAGIRVLSEHAIGGMKRLKAASDIYRNKRPNLDDTFNLLAAGLWNFHLQHQN
jgi:hypothetical protein